MRIGFFLLHNYSMIALVNALEPLRLANYLSGKTLYQWALIDAAPGGTTASNGLAFQPTPQHAETECDAVFVCGGIDVAASVTREVVQRIRKTVSRGVAIGALCTGTYALAKAGVADGYLDAHSTKLQGLTISGGYDMGDGRIAEKGWFA